MKLTGIIVIIIFSSLSLGFLVFMCAFAFQIIMDTLDEHKMRKKNREI
jgi:hypothetical protein